MGLFNNNKIIRKRVNAVTKSRKETRDAIVWDILSDQRLCRVKIQGSDNFLYARYPENWEATPTFLKVGNAVTVAHRGGNKNILEIIGHGRNLPTFPNGTPTPPEPASSNAVIVGMAVLPTNPPSMTVTIAAGTFRLNNALYNLDDILPEMASPGDYTMIAGSNLIMGQGWLNSVTFDAPPAAGYSRVDLIVIGSDLVLDVVKGTDFLNSVEEAVFPIIPANHIKVAHVFIFGGKIQTDDEWIVDTELGYVYNLKGTVYDSTVENYQINKEWEKAYPTKVYLTHYHELPVGGGYLCREQYSNYIALDRATTVSCTDNCPPCNIAHVAIGFRLVDQFNRHYVPLNAGDDEIVVETTSGSLVLTGASDCHIIGNAEGYGSQDHKKWFFDMKNTIREFCLQSTETAHPAVKIYLKSQGSSYILFSFVNIKLNIGCDAFAVGVG